MVALVVVVYRINECVCTDVKVCFSCTAVVLVSSSLAYMCRLHFTLTDHTDKGAVSQGDIPCVIVP